MQIWNLTFRLHGLLHLLRVLHQAHRQAHAYRDQREQQQQQPRPVIRHLWQNCEMFIAEAFSELRATLFFVSHTNPSSKRGRESSSFWQWISDRVSGSQDHTMISYFSSNFISVQRYWVTILKKLKCHVMRRNVGSLFLRCVERPSVGAIGRSIKGLPCMYTRVDVRAYLHGYIKILHVVEFHNKISSLTVWRIDDVTTWCNRRGLLSSIMTLSYDVESKRVLSHTRVTWQVDFIELCLIAWRRYSPTCIKRFREK